MDVHKEPKRLRTWTKPGIICVLLSIAFFVWGLFLTWLGWTQQAVCERLLHYRETTGTLLQVDVDHRLLCDFPLVRFRYTVDGKDYESIRYSYNKYQRYYAPGAWLAVYKDGVGKSVSVYYDPQEPEVAILDYIGPGLVRKEMATCFLYKVFGGILMGSVVAAMIVALRMKK